NADFIEVAPTERAIELSEEDIIELIDNFSDIDLWKSKFPEHSWVLRGFSIMTLFDATIENAVSSFKSNLLKDDSLTQFKEIETIFRSIYKISDLRIGVTIFGNARKDYDLRIVEQQLSSHLLYNSSSEECEGLVCNEALEHLTTNHDFLVVSDIAEHPMSNPKEKHPIDKLNEQNVKSLIFVPLVEG